MYEELEHLGSAESYVDDILEIVDQIKLFDTFEVDEIKVLCHYMQCYAAPRDYPLLTEGEEGSYLLVLLSGAVNVMKNIPGRGPQLIAEVGEGKSLGEMSLVDGHPRFASCITMVPTDFAVLTREALNAILLQHPRLANKFLLVLLQLMSSRLRDTCDRFLPSVVGAPVDSVIT